MEENMTSKDNIQKNQNSSLIPVENNKNTNYQLNNSDPDSLNILCEDQHIENDDIIKNNINEQSHKKEASIQPKTTKMKKKRRTTKRQHGFGKKMVKKQLEFRHVQSSLILIDSKQFYLNGDIFIDLNQEFSQFTHISSMNFFKTPSLVIDNKDLGELQIDIYSTQKWQDNFLELAEYFLNQPNKNLHFLGELLLIHQEKVILMKNISHMIAAMPLHDQFLEACEKSFQTFRIESNKKVRQMIEDSTIKFYKTMVVKINYNLGSYEIVSMALSQALLALLGISTEQASSFIMRKGIFDFNFTLEEFTYQIFFLNIFNKQNKVNKEYSSPRVLLTFDGIEVVCQANTILMENTDNFITQKMGVHISELVFVVDYDVTPSMLRKVIEIRDNQRSSYNSKLCLENESDWNYAVQYREFLDQFYPDGCMRWIKKSEIEESK